MNAYLDQAVPDDPRRFRPDSRRKGFERDRSLFFLVDLNGVHGELVVDIYSEYVTLNLRAYPTTADDNALRSPDLQQLLAVVETLSTHAAGLGGEGAKSAESAGVSFLDDTANQNRINYIYSDFWDEHLPADLNPEDHFRSEGFTTSAIFRGLVLRRAANGDEYRKHVEMPERDEPGRSIHKPVIAPTFEPPQSKPDDLKDVDPHHDIRQSTARFHGLQHLLNKNSPFFTKILGFRRDRARERDHEGGNAILCGLLDGLAIFGSSFGDVDTTQHDRSIVKYFIIYSGPSRNQLARLIRRVHYCGDNRIFSLIDAEQVEEAGDRIRNYERELDKIGEMKSDQTGRLEAVRRQVLVQARSGRGGIRHRMRRSVYHWESLQHRMQNLRIRRLPGWQTYEDFISRIFEPQVNSYLRVGKELDAIETRITRDEQALTTKGSHNLQFYLIPFVLLSVFEALGYIRDVVYDEDTAQFSDPVTVWLAETIGIGPEWVFPVVWGGAIALGVTILVVGIIAILRRR